MNIIVQRLLSNLIFLMNEILFHEFLGQLTFLAIIILKSAIRYKKLKQLDYHIKRRRFNFTINSRITIHCKI